MVEIESLENDSYESIGGDVHENKDERGWEKLMGEDLVMKVIKSQPPRDKKGPQEIQPNDAVLIDFVGRLASSPSETDGSIFQSAKGWFIVVGDGDVVPALELAIRFMKSGETARVWSHSKYAFSAGMRTDESTTVPPHANVMFEVTVTQIVQDTSRLNPYFTIQKALSRKKIANDIYQHEFCPPPRTEHDPNCEAAMTRALKLYKKAATEMETLLQGTYFSNVEQDHPQRHEANQIMLDSLNNIVAVYMREKEYHKAKQAAVEVLRKDCKNLKALLRAAKASLLDPASTMEEVHAALDKAEKEITYKDPVEEKELNRLKAHLKRKKQEYKKKTKEMFSDKLKGDSSTTKKDLESPVGNQTREEINESESETEGTSFWRFRYFSIFLRIIVPFVLFLMYWLKSFNEKILEGEAIDEDSSRRINLDL